MQKIFETEILKDTCGCYNREQIEQLSCMQDELFYLEQGAESETPMAGKYWFICKKVATKAQNEQIVKDIVDILLPVYRDVYKDNEDLIKLLEVARDHRIGEETVGQLKAQQHLVYSKKDTLNKQLYGSTMLYTVYRTSTFGDEEASRTSTAELLYAMISVAYTNNPNDAELENILQTYLRDFIKA